MSEESPYYRTRELPDDVRWRLERADGFLDLGMLERARSELDEVPSDFHVHADVRRLRLRLLLDQQAWAEAREVARSLRDSDPSTYDGWILYAYATRRSENVGAARRILEEAVQRFPSVSVIRFNLACYACQSGNLEEARRWLRQAFLLDRSFRDTALEDDDLRALWSEVESGAL